MNRARIAPLMIAALVSACAGLPPKPAPVALSTNAPVSDLENAAGDSWPAKDWWQRYQDPTLNTLVDEALATAPSLATARARFDAARESVREAGAQSGAQVDLQSDAERMGLRSEPAAVHNGAQRFAAQPFHDDVGPTAELAHVVRGDHIGMRAAARQLGFQDEAAVDGFFLRVNEA